MTPDWRDILQSTPMRLTFRLVALFALISLLTFAATWWLVSQALLDTTETALDLELAELAASAQPDRIANAVRDMAAQADPEHTILRYDFAGGAVGNYPEPIPGKDLREFDPPDRHDHSPSDFHDSYVVKSREVPGGVLTIGQSTDAFEELREVFGQVLSFTLLPTLLAVLVFLFMRSMVTLSAVIFLITPSLPMGAVTVMRLDEAGLTSQAAAFSTCIMAVVGSLALLLLHFGTQRRKPGSKAA